MKNNIRVLAVDLDLSQVDMLAGLLCEASPRFVLVGCIAGAGEVSHFIAHRKPHLLVVKGAQPSLIEYVQLKNSGFEFDLIAFESENSGTSGNGESTVFAYWAPPLNTAQALDDLSRYQQIKTGSKWSRLTFSVGQSLKVVKPESIVLVRAEGSYSAVVLENGDEIVVSRNLKSIEDELIEYPFLFRSHKSFIVNLHSVQECCRGGSLRIKLTGNHEAGLSSEKQETFLKLLQDL
jgi:hypothetical protein